MIINIRGTSGSGKSTLIRQVIDTHGLVPAVGTPTLDEYFISTGKRWSRAKNYGYWTKYPVEGASLKKLEVPANMDSLAHNHGFNAGGEMDYESKGLAVVGDYSNECGGCDSITTKGRAQDEIQNRIRYFAQVNHVLFEGLLITHIYGRYRDMALKEYPGQMIFACMDTPLNVCIDRVIARRNASGRARAVFNPENTIKMYDDLLRVVRKCEQDKVPFVWLNHTRAYDHLMELLGL